MSELIRLVTPAVSTKHLKYPEGDLFEFVFDLDREMFVFKFETEGMIYSDADGEIEEIDSHLFFYRSIQDLKEKGFDFIYDNYEEKYKLIINSFNNLIFFKNKRDMMRFRSRIFEILYPQTKNSSNEELQLLGIK